MALHSITAHHVHCTRLDGTSADQVLDASLSIEAGTFNLLIGRKGCGKNLLLRLLSLLEAPDKGEVLLDGLSTAAWDEGKRRAHCNRHFSFVFESPFLLPSFNVIENIAMPFLKSEEADDTAAQERTAEILQFTGLRDCTTLSVERLPLWVQLRVSLARALILHPKALFVENIDQLLRNDELISFLDLLNRTRRTFRCAIIATASHLEIAPYSTHAFELAEGRIIRDWNPGGLLS